MLKDLKSPQKNSSAWCSQSDRLQMSEDTLSAIRRVRREVVNCMRVLMRMAKQQKRTPSIATVGEEIEASSRSKEMFEIVEEMLRKTKCLCSLMDNRFGHVLTPKLFCSPIFAKLNQGDLNSRQ